MYIIYLDAIIVYREPLQYLYATTSFTKNKLALLTVKINTIAIVTVAQNLFPI